MWMIWSSFSWGLVFSMRMGTVLLEFWRGNSISSLTWGKKNAFFNFNFILWNSKIWRSEPSNEDSITLLRSSGVNFERLTCDGIPPEMFAAYLTMSGLLLEPNIIWIAFHGYLKFFIIFRITLLLVNVFLDATILHTSSKFWSMSHYQPKRKGSCKFFAFCFRKFMT